MKNPKRYTVTAALPYANGPVHIGHLAGVYIPADIYVRYLRLKQKDVLFICGSDEHGVPITISAKKENVKPQDIVDKYHNINKKAFENLGISFDIYSRTSNKTHHETASEFFKTLYDKNIFIEQETEQYYDAKAKQFLADRYITGTCPHCNFDKAYGDQCESCGTSLSPTDLINPQSTISGNKPELKKTKHWFLPLDKYEAWLKEWILEEHKEWKPNVYGQCKSWLDNGLSPRAVTRDLNWGVPVPVKGGEGKVLYVWFDAPIGYISATKGHTPDWEKYWKDEETKLVHFIGKDNIVFHCLIFPTMLKAEGSYILPENVPANEFLNLEDDKISTSRNWAVWLHEYLKEFENQQDVLRYVLTANAPETKDNNFTWHNFQLKNNSELVAILGNFINRVLVLTHKYFSGKVPAYETLNDNAKTVYNTIENIPQNIENYIEQYKLREALSEMIKLARIGNKYLTEEEPWKVFKTNPEQVAIVLNTCLQIIAKLSILSEPFMPFTAQKIKQMLNIEQNKWDIAYKKDLLDFNHTLNKPIHLFQKIDDKVISNQLEKLEQTKIKNTQDQKPKVAAPKPEIQFDDFGKMDIRVSTILEAEKVPKTKKLLKLKIDTGCDIRTIVSGIAEYYKPEDIIGKQVCVLINLAPKKLRGIESQGMVLMAQNAKDNALYFVLPEQITANGSEIS